MMTWTDTEHIVSDPWSGELLMRGAEIRASTVYAWCSYQGRNAFREQYPRARELIGDAAIDAVLELGEPDPILVGASDDLLRVSRGWCADHVTVVIVDDVLRIPIEDIERHVEAYATALRTAAAQWDEVGG